MLISQENKKDEAIEAHVIMNDEIKTIELLDEEETCKKYTEQLLEDLFQTNVEQAHENLIEKRKNLVTWLEKNRIPITSNMNDEDNSSISIMDSVFIHKPYNVENCESTNEIILNKVINLIQKFNQNKN